MDEPAEIEEYQNGGVHVSVYKYLDPPHNQFILKIGGCCYLEVREQELLELWEFLDSYVPETFGRKVKRKKAWFRRGR